MQVGRAAADPWKVSKPWRTAPILKKTTKSRAMDQRCVLPPDVPHTQMKDPDPRSLPRLDRVRVVQQFGLDRFVFVAFFVRWFWGFFF